MADNMIPKGTRLGDGERYMIGHVIAVGGMGSVYEARDVRLSDVCAIKAMRIAGADPTDLEAFRREAKLLAKLRNPGVVAVRDSFEDKNRAYLVMDYVPGLNLYDLHKREPLEGDDPDDLPLTRLPEAQVVSYGRMMAETLAALHKTDPPIIYRDLKPHNIIRREYDGRLVLLDFGIARFAQSSYADDEGEPLGTPGYAAPEQYVRDAQIDGRTDIYALGVLLLELATGYNPRDPKAPRILPAPREIRPEMSPSLARILEKCLEPNRERRYATADLLLADLQRWRPSASRSLPTDLETEEPNWTFDLGAPITSAAYASPSTVYYADNAGMVCALNPQNGEPYWMHREGNEETARAAIRISASLTKLHRMIAFTHAFEGPQGAAPKLGVGIVDARSGKQIWMTKSPFGRGVIPMLTDTAMLVCAVTEPNELIGISLYDTSLGWRRPLEASPLACVKAPAADGRPEIVLVGDRVGTLKAYIADDGRSLWSTRVAHGALIAPPLVARDRVYVGGARGDASFAAVDLVTGEIKWKVPLAGEAIASACLVLEGDVVVVPTRNSGLFGLRPSDGHLLWHDIRFARALTGALQIPASAVVAVTEFGPSAQISLVSVEGDPVIKWQASLDPEGAIAPPMVSSGFLVAAAADGLVRGWQMK